jgi:hypothetical protein
MFYSSSELDRIFTNMVQKYLHESGQLSFGNIRVRYKCYEKYINISYSFNNGPK